MSERCHRCHTILTSEDKYWYGVACESCETDLKWEEYEQHTPSNQPTGAGEQSALVCVFCAITLADCETYCCTGCADQLQPDPNFDMTGDDNG